MSDWFVLAAGVACASLGGEAFVRGAVGVARWARVAPGIVGATVAAFATSSPELTVSITSALAGRPGIALGDALGSNVVNIALILGAALCLGPIACPRDSVQRDFPVTLLVPAVTALLAFDGVLSRVDGVLMIAMFAGWVTAVVREARRQRSATGTLLGEPSAWKAWMYCALGLALLVAAGTLIVHGATGIAEALGIHPFLIGATVVAAGTSAPELATTVVARLRGHDEVGFGTVLGSNIFNGLLIVGTAATIAPIPVQWREVGVALLAGVLVVGCTIPDRRGMLDRRRGFLLLALYAAYLAAIVQSA